ncbi:Leucine-rich repeat receptor-like protein kinase [Seminavis robusta]|uniref:Leucine-rich repeat receptor-like protein kinase n=1 Tax=Seminavis robusta TaxID=568900 RepID=A0A9N8EM86_9STRA|nr:Leucine-rich repeat receptor-like protein kinase [Seminavis robusta]|eukprot:Sro1324_g262790.1 Leucine-rich repeat receptor-like protein kinase (879) ;mRNA; r:16819-19455
MNSSSSSSSASYGRRRRLPLHYSSSKRGSPSPSRTTSPTGRSASPLSLSGYTSPLASSPPSSFYKHRAQSQSYANSSFTNSFTNSFTSSHNSSSRQLQLDERRRQRVLHSHPLDQSESESYHEDPLHQDVSGNSTMSRRFFLTPPERLQVDQSVNLMDVETGHYEFDNTPPQANTSRMHYGELPSKRKNNKHMSSWLSSLLFGDSNHNDKSNEALEAVSSHSHNPRASFTSATSKQDDPIEMFQDEQVIFQDEEVGLSPPQSRRSSTRKRSSKKKKKKKTKTKQASNADKSNSDGDPKKDASALNFPNSFNPNDWEQRAQSSKESQLQDGDDTVVVAHRSSQKGKKPKKKKKSKRLRSKLKKLKPSRMVLAFLGLTLLLTLILGTFLIILVATDTIWVFQSHHQDHTTDAHPIPVVLQERNHSFLELEELPASTQFLLTGTGHETPQHEALQWITADPHVTLVGIGHNSNTTYSPLETLSARQRFALATLYYSHHSHSQLSEWQPPHPERTHWLDYSVNECDWFGILPQYHGNYSVCNRYHQLHSLLLRHYQFQGRLPVEELGLLSNLKRVELGFNQIQGILPPTLLASWKNLEYLGMEHNQMTGQLPTTLGLLTNSNGLHGIQLSYNQFSGTLPSEIGLLVPHLRLFNVMHNQLSGSIPTTLGGFVSLDETSDGYGTEYAALQELSLNGNFFSGKIPSELGRLTQLTKLGLHHNLELDHQILPKEICQLPLLESITVDCDIVKCPTSVACPCQCMANWSNGRHPVSHTTVFTLNRDGTTSSSNAQEEDEQQPLHGDSGAVAHHTSTAATTKTAHGGAAVQKRDEQNVFDQEHNPYVQELQPRTFSLNVDKRKKKQENVFHNNGNENRRGLLRASIAS